ncbi:hypothetical protein N7494_009737 [Penicillium frequentans]|uniref:Uncharacterized protein n=1 Tax=Penicillium frequentans TaxID=3151616 RepID=A0AAD6CQL3_9EURO|nr:hypothetical protein N7494_009737 [Penicillium glabrum]
MARRYSHISPYIRCDVEPEGNMKSATYAWMQLVRKQGTDSVTKVEQNRLSSINGPPRTSNCAIIFFMTKLRTNRDINPKHQTMSLPSKILGMHESPSPWLGASTAKLIIINALEENEGDVIESFRFHQKVARSNFLDMRITQNGAVLFLGKAP